MRNLIWNHKHAFVSIMLLSLAVAFVQPWSIHLLSNTLDSVGFLDFASLGRALLFYCIVRIVADILCEAVDYWQRYYIKMLQKDLKRTLNDKIYVGRYCELQKFNSGELLTAYALCDDVVMHLILPGFQLLGFIVGIIVSCYYLFVMSPGVLLTVLLFLFIWRVGVRLLQKKALEAEARDIESRKAYNRFVSEVIFAKEEVVGWNRERFTNRKMDERFSKKKRTTAGKRLYSTLCPQTDTLVATVSVLAAILITANSGAPATQAIAIYLYVSLIYKPMVDINALCHELYGVKLKMKEVNHYFDVGSEGESVKRPDCKGEIYIPKLNIILGNKTAFDFEDIHIYPQALTVLWGESGSGKTTFINALLGFVKSTGDVYIDGQPIHSEDVYSLRAMCSLVAQEPLLFSGSLLDNIVLDQEYSEEKLIHVMNLSALCDADFDLEKLDTTVIKENGRNLSQGQRQRISIARALYADRPIVIFDEPTSALDDKNALQIIEMLKALKRERTVIVSTHDLRILELADQKISFGI